MMRLIKVFIVILLLALVGIVGGWFYVTDKVAEQINAEYAGKKMAVKGVDKKDYFISFKNATPTGFPFKFAWNIHGWFEESRSAKISYTSPIIVGYDILLQKAFINYDGEIKSAYKPEKSGFGAKLLIENYAIDVDLPLSLGLVETLKDMKEPAAIINHIGDIKISTNNVLVFDLLDGEKFYDKDYESLKFTFVPKKEYESLEDIMNNIPQHYTADYVVKTNSIDARARRLPVSLFYGFSAIPAGFDVKADIVIDTKASKLDDIQKGLSVKANAKCTSRFVNVPSFKLDYKSGNDSMGRDYTINSTSKIHVKNGAFEQLFDNYKSIAKQVSSTPSGRKLDNEIRYIIKNKNAFRFKDLENSDYDFTIKADSSHAKGKTSMNLEDFSIFSGDSGLQIKHKMESFSKNKWLINGVLFVKNYPSVIDFTSGYIYRFGKFRTLSKEARALYVDVNKAFFKDISDHPNADSKDLSFVYEINSNNLDKTKFGTVRVDQIPQLYSLMLYNKLFAKVGHGGDVLKRMQQIIPGIDGNDKLLQKILPKISSGQDVEKSIQKQIDKAIPKDAKNILNKIAPKGKLGKNLFKNFGK